MTAALHTKVFRLDALMAEGQRALAEAGVEQPNRTAGRLLGEALGVSQAFVLARPESAVAPEARERFLALTKRRAAGEPLQYLLGRWEFFGYAFEVSPEALIPRPETELLAEVVMARARGDERLLDAGTGTGCLAIALKKELPGLKVFAADVSAAALRLAQRNARRHSADVAMIRGDWLAAVRPDSLDIVVSNPPYVAQRERGALGRELAYEPETALFAGEDGLDAYRRLIPQAGRALRADGLLVLELGHNSSVDVREILSCGAWEVASVERDLAGHERALAARNLSCAN